MAAIRKTRLEMGESAIVMGLGILGMLAVKLLHVAGAIPIIAADPNPTRREIALKNGVSFVKSTAVEPGGFERRQLVVCGTKGTVEIKPLEWIDLESHSIIQALTTSVREVFDNDWNKKGEYVTTPVYGRYDAMFRAFADYINKEKENPYGYEYERKLHKLILKACGK